MKACVSSVIKSKTSNHAIGCSTNVAKLGKVLHLKSIWLYLNTIVIGFG